MPSTADAGLRQRPPLPRDGQNIPLPLGGLAPVHRRMPRLRRRARRHGVVALLLGASACACAAAALSLPSTPAFAVYRDRAGVHLAGVLLRQEGQAAAGVTAYGGAAVLLVAAARSGHVVVAAATTLNGTLAWGRCVAMGRAPSFSSARCSFALGSVQATSTDTYDVAQRRWTRVYSNGSRTTFTVPENAQPIPVPLPLGLSP